MYKLAIITTHPIQYYAPVFKHMTNRGINCKVFYTWGKGGLQGKYDPNFGKTIEWDIPLLEGYEYEFCENVATKPGSHHFKGINNPALIASIKKYEATHLLVFGWCFKSHLQVMRHFKGKIPVWFRGDSNLLDQPKGFSVKTLIRKIFLTWIYKHIDLAFYVGSANKSYYQHFGLKDKQLVFAPHAIDNARFSVLNDEQLLWINTTKTNANVANGDISIVFCGKFENKKNPLLLINAINQLGKKNVHLFVVGNGVLESQLKSAAAQNQNIHFISFQNQSMMPAVYRLGDIFCLPSQGPGETWGLAVNEAMACSRAILVSDKCGCAEDLVENGVNGFIFESNNELALIECINKMTQNKTDLNNFSKNSLSKIQSWNFENFVQELVELLHYN